MIKGAFAGAYAVGRRHAESGEECRPMPKKLVRALVLDACSCDGATAVAGYIARVHRMGYRAGYEDLFAGERAHRECDTSGISHIEDMVVRRLVRDKSRVG